MSEQRYSRLFSLPENLYAAGSPVLICAGALLKDNQSEKILAQLKLKNIREKEIKAITVSISPLDTLDHPLGSPLEYQYLDLTAFRDDEFGQKTPIFLPDESTRAFSVEVTEVIFSDNTLWHPSGAPWQPLSQPPFLEDCIDDRELLRQYRIKFGQDCRFQLTREKDLWHCPCGGLNLQDEPACHTCGKVASELENPDMEKLQEEKEQRLALEAKKAQEAMVAAELRKKQLIKVAKIAVPAVIVIIVAGCFISDQMKKGELYDRGIAAQQEGNYSQAISIFEELGGFKDSPEQIHQTNYLKAMEAAEDGDYEEAIQLLKELGDYQDSPQQLEAVTKAQQQEIQEENQEDYEEAMKYLAMGNTERAYQIFSSLEYKDSPAMAQACILQEYVNGFSSGYDVIEYLTENRESYPLITQEEIGSILVGEWLVRSRFNPSAGYYIATLNADGTGSIPEDAYYPLVRWTMTEDRFYYNTYSENSLQPFDTASDLNCYELRRVTDDMYVAFKRSNPSSTSSGGGANLIFVPAGSDWSKRFQTAVEFM